MSVVYIGRIDSKILRINCGVESWLKIVMIPKIRGKPSSATSSCLVPCGTPGAHIKLFSEQFRVIRPIQHRVLSVTHAVLLVCVISCVVVASAGPVLVAMGRHGAWINYRSVLGSETESTAAAVSEF